MKQVTAKQAVWLTLPTLLPFPRVRRRKRTASRTVSIPKQAAADTERGFWLEDLLNLALLGILAGATVAATAWIGREFLGQVLQYGSLDLLRGFGAM